MNNILILLETKNGKIKKSGLELLSLAAGQGCGCTGVVFGPLAEGELESLRGRGLGALVQAQGEPFNQGHPEMLSAALACILSEQKAEALLLPASTQGKDLASRVAALSNGALAMDCVAVDLAQGTAKRPVFAGKAIATVKLDARPAIFALRPNVCPVAAAGAGEIPPVRTWQGALPEPKLELVERKTTAVARPDLSEADVVVSGGRGMKSAENFKALELLADALGTGATVGASRAAVDAGYSPVSRQVGQTGKVVSPTLYIACGISGAIQHMAGMKTSKVVVAINKDPEAPIFTKADYGIVADLFEAVPLLTKELQARRR